jgi:hypothetical protein
MTQQQIYCNIWIPLKTYDLAEWLIRSFNIQPGYGLARYLGVSRRYNNYRAVQVWVLEQQRTWPAEKRTTGILRREFSLLLPDDHF